MNLGLRCALLTLVTLALGALLLAAAVFRALHEPPATNSFVLLADALNHGRFDFTGCYDFECVEAGGKTYLVQPPFPAVAAMPFVAAFGLGFHGFIALSLAIAAVTLVLWQRILDRAGVEPETRNAILLALATATPFAYVVLRADGVWLFAHVVGFLLASLAVHEAGARRLLIAGLMIGLAFLSRQLSLFLLPFVLVIALEWDERILLPSRSTIAKGLRLAAGFALPFAFYLAYNWLRFGNAFETGHSILVAQAPTSPDQTMVTQRLAAIGVFAKDYVLFNLFYTFIQGFHADFAAPLMTKLQGMDPNGTSILAASPFLLFLFFVPMNRVAFWGFVSAAAMIGLLTVYHSNGFKQYNVQRYLMDYLPALLILLALSLRREQIPVFKLLVAWGALLNVATVGVLALTHAG